MTDQPALFPTDDLHPAETAWLASLRAGHITWHQAAEQAMRQLADTHRPFSSDDLRNLLADAGEPPTPNAYGGLFMSWSKQGLIQRIGGGTSTMPRRHGGHRHLWQGTTTNLKEAA